MAKAAGVTPLKILIVGNSNTGKSCLTLRFVDEQFTSSFVPTIGIDFHVKSVELSDGRKVKLQLWDTAGQERFHNVTRTYFRGAAAVLLVYDVTDRDSFQWLSKWRDQVADYVGDINSVVIAVVGNKIDRAEDRVVSTEEGAESAKHLGAPLFFETSAKTGENINELFIKVAEAAAAKLPPVTNSSAVADDPAVRKAVQVGAPGSAAAGSGKPGGDQCGCN